MDPERIEEAVKDICYAIAGVGDSIQNPDEPYVESESGARIESLIEAVVYSGDATRKLANAVTPLGVCGCRTEDGGRVESLTEAMVFIGNGLWKIGNAIEQLAEAVERIADKGE